MVFLDHLQAVLIFKQAGTPIDVNDNSASGGGITILASYRPSKVLTANSAGAVVMFAADSINAAHDVVSGWILSCTENRRTVL